MEQEQKERQEIIVLDEGIEAQSIDGPGPQGACCWVSFIPYRG